jgi:FkbM family methyltransferase
MINKIRDYINSNKLIMRFFNCGKDYAIYDKTKIISGAQFIDHFVTKDGVKYKVDGLSNTMLLETRTEYDWSDMRPDDIVLDLGSNTGGFAITAAKYVKHIYAVEPLWGNYIKEHIKLNNYNNITILPVAIGTSGGVIDITWNKTTAKNVPIRSLDDIRNIILSLSNGEHKITFIKCDIEGI